MRVKIDLPIAEIVPHSRSMCLLEQALEGDEESLVAQLSIHPNTTFLQGDGVGSWLGIEYMAQTVAAWAGWHARLRGEQPKIGFLLGTRRYSCNRAQFKLGELLRIEIRREFSGDNGLGQFACSISINGEIVASAALNVFAPNDPHAFLSGNAHD